MIFVDYPGHVIAAALLMLFAALVWYAFRSAEFRKVKSKAFRWPLIALQYVPIVLLLLILWNPSSAKVTATFARNRTLVFFDTSESMSLVEDGDTTRLDKAVRVFMEGFGPDDSEGPEYRVFGFDGHVYHTGSPDLLRRWGSESNMHGATALLAKHDTDRSDGSRSETAIPEERVVGAVVFTDGQVEDKAIRTYLPLQHKDFPVLLVGVGSREPHADVAIKSMSTPARATVETAYQVDIVVTASNLGDGPAVVELLKDDHVIDSQQIDAERLVPKERGRASAGSQTPDVTVRFAVGADELGSHVLTARIEPHDGEINVANNVRRATVDVVQESTVRVLLYAQWASADIGKIRQALARDSRVHLDLGFDVIRDPALSQRAFETSGHVRFPSDWDKLCEYDVVILGPCRADGPSDVQLDMLYRFVADRGGGLVLLPGRTVADFASGRDNKGRSLLPVTLDADSQGRWSDSPGRIEATFEGIESRAVRPAALAEHDERVLPYYESTSGKPASSSLAAVQDTPVICVHRLGRGRICLLNISKLFQLYREDKQGGLLAELTSSVIGYLGPTAHREAGIELFAEQAKDSPQHIDISARVFDSQFAPVSGANVLLTVGDQVVGMDSAGQGRYTARVDRDISDSVVATIQAESNGVFLGQKSVAVNLPPAQTEMSHVDLDERFLAALAKRLGAKYVHIDDVDRKTAKVFESRRRVASARQIQSCWPNWPLLLILCVLLSANWFFRRAVGLV